MSSCWGGRAGGCPPKRSRPGFGADGAPKPSSQPCCLVGGPPKTSMPPCCCCGPPTGSLPCGAPKPPTVGPIGGSGRLKVSRKGIACGCCPTWSGESCSASGSLFAALKRSPPPPQGRIALRAIIDPKCIERRRGLRRLAEAALLHAGRSTEPEAAPAARPTCEGLTRVVGRSSPKPLRQTERVCHRLGMAVPPNGSCAGAALNGSANCPLGGGCQTCLCPSAVARELRMGPVAVAQAGSSEWVITRGLLRGHPCEWVA
jgi:hypothetical protein